MTEDLTKLSKNALEQKKQELQFLGSELAASGAELPRSLSEQFDAVCEELKTRTQEH